MDPQYFDALTRRLSHAGSRRRVLTALAGGAFGQLLILPRADEAAAKCKKGWKRCLGPGLGCQNLNTDPDHCGECNHACPTGCCVKGKCREMCGDTCCADCFVELFSDGNPNEANTVCCMQSGGTICEHNKPGPGDDRCCYSNEVCVNGKCCCHAMGAGCLGAIKCGGKCCAAAACCNNGKCCKKGFVCATKNVGDEKTCVRADRDCAGDEECFASETCHGGKCCSGPRMCVNGVGTEFCCTADTYCELSGHPSANCCPINTVCENTYRGHRVRI